MAHRRVLPRLHPKIAHRAPGFAVELVLLIVALLILLLVFAVLIGLVNQNHGFDGEPVTHSSENSLGTCKQIPDDWMSHFNKAGTQSGADTALIAAIFAAGEHRFYQGGETWPGYNENPAYGTQLNPEKHDGGAGGFVRGPTQFKEETFQNLRGSVGRDAGPSRFGTGFLVEPYIERLEPSLIVTGNYLAKMGGKAGANELAIKRAIYGYYNGEGALKHFDENHFYVALVFPAYQEYTACMNGSSLPGGLTAHGTYAPVLDPALLKTFVPFRPHHGNPADPAVDLAVVTGTKAYAFTNGKVVAVFRHHFNTYHKIGGSNDCGMGFDMRGNDGASYQYCHFDVLAPEIVIGAQLTSGQFVGFTDNTGYSSGPHLHFGSPGPKTLERADALRKKLESTLE